MFPTQNQSSSGGGGGGLFGGGGNTSSQPQQGGTSLFGAGNANPQQTTSLFGRDTTQQPQSNTLFGGTMTQQPQQQQPQTSSLFGGAQQQQPSLFASTQQQQQASTSLLFRPQQQPPSNTSTNPQQTHLSTLLQTGLNTSQQPTAHSALANTQQHDLARSRLAASGIESRPSTEKSLITQIQTLVRKWDPQSQDTLMQAYLYNAVNAAYAPFYYRNTEMGEGEKEWEDALAAKPKATSEGEEFVPVLVRGFHALGQRVEFQARTVNEMRARLHEMNYSLDAVMAKHQQSLSVRVENARRQHAALSSRCLRLAVKTQVLRAGNWEMQPQEEILRSHLLRLENAIASSNFSAREEEIWGRMVALRERARWLEQETARLGSAGQSQSQGQGGGATVPDYVLEKTKKILKDYDGQIEHLGRELEEVRREFAGWQGR